MKAFACALFCCSLALAAFAASGQYKGPAVETCRGYAERELRRDNANIKALAFDDDQHLIIERTTQKLGSQFVSSILSGNGGIVYQRGQAIEMSFICLLADERRALFFHWVPRKDASALTQCARAGGSGVAACLDSLLLVAEQDLNQLYAAQYQDARDADAAAKNENASNAFRSSAESWRAYRDAECGRRSGTDAQMGCMVELTKRRALDLKR